MYLVHLGRFHLWGQIRLLFGDASGKKNHLRKIILGIARQLQGRSERERKCRVRLPQWLEEADHKQDRLAELGKGISDWSILWRMYYSVWMAWEIAWALDYGRRADSYSCWPLKKYLPEKSWLWCIFPLRFYAAFPLLLKQWNFPNFWKDERLFA